MREGYYKPLKGWNFVGYSILFSIPVIGLIFLIVFSFSDKNANRKAYARSFWCWILLIGIGVAAACLFGGLNLQRVMRAMGI